MTTTLDTLNATFSQDASFCSTTAFPVHVVDVPASAWARAGLPKADLVLGWTPPTPTTPCGAIIRYCPDVLAYSLGALPDDVATNVVVRTLSQLNRATLAELATDATRDPLDLYSDAEDAADAQLGAIPDDPDETGFVAFLAEFRFTLMESV